MIEFIAVIILALIAFKLYSNKGKASADEVYYFPEERYLSSGGLVNFKSALNLYTVAEFSETTHANHLGVVKELGFSDFILIYDKFLNKFITARVKIVGADGYARSAKMGFFKYLSSDKDWAELNIHFSLDDYNVFVSEIKEAAAERELLGKRTYFLYELNGYQAFDLGGGDMIYYIDSITKVEKYNDYYADKIGLMIELRSKSNSVDERQAALRKELIDRFDEVNS